MRESTVVAVLSNPWTPWLVGLLLLVAARLVELWRVRLRRQSLIQAFNNSTAARLELSTHSLGGVLSGQLRPAPEPFAACQVDALVLPRYDPLGFVWTRLTRRDDHLVVQATLTRRPANEVVWLRGKLPGLALGERELWVRRRLDFVGSEYALRGQNPAGLDHAFHELQTRFGPFLGRVVLQADAKPHCVVELAATRLNADEIPALVAAVRALGRGALRE